ncbi:MAG: hypothetical protein IKZ98_03825 [Clostridia bacterium]|nr:hypothetical protein [Clostridia bacterium]
MKKITALLLALCMLLAVVPVLGEEGPAGNWYMTLADVTLGYILLNEDGTAIVNIASQEDITGSWSADGDTVTITAQNQPLDFVYDGSSLASDAFPLSLTREEGRLPMDVISKMMSGGEYELPEGMTELEMTTIAMNFVAEYTKIMESTSTSTAATSTGTAPSGSAEATVVKENFKIVKSYSGYTGLYIAKLQNETDTPLFVTDGSMQLTDANGKTVGEAKYLYPCGSKYLEPGETTFVAMQADLDENIEVNVAKHVDTKFDSYYNTDFAVSVENPTYVKGTSEYDSDVMRVTVVNNSDEPLAGIEAVLVLEDADGNLLCISTESLYRYELGPNSSITLVSSVDNKIRDYCAQNGIEPTTVEAFAWVENKDW